MPPDDCDQRVAEARAAAYRHGIADASPSETAKVIRGLERELSEARAAGLREAPHRIAALEKALSAAADWFTSQGWHTTAGDIRALLQAPEGVAPTGDYLSEREQRRLACTCGCPFVEHNEYGCKPHGFHEFRRVYAKAAPAP